MQRVAVLVLFTCVMAYHHDNHNHHGYNAPAASALPTAPASPTASASPAAAAAQAVTVTPSGTIRGGLNVTRRGRTFESYRGIRYAKPPVGDLRFQPPKPITRYEDPVDASQEGPACPQLAGPGYYVDEDCLTLNVYTPLKKDRSKPLPVILYIHPGGFYAMTGRSDRAGPHYLLDRDIVLVTINYRLATLGFLSTGDEHAPGNNGMKDQVVALKWVQRNIAAFGGDPNSVTIAGTSAGSRSVMLHMISPMSQGLFHRGISMSGSTFGKEPLPTHQKPLAVRQAEILNCSTTSSKAIIDCLKTKPWKALSDSLLRFFDFGTHDPIIIWSPVVEPDFGQERYLTEEPLDVVREGKWNAVPHIISQTHDEFAWLSRSVIRNTTLLQQMNEQWESVAPISFILPRNNSWVAARRLRSHYLNDQRLANDDRSAALLGRMYADALMAFPIQRMSKLLSKHSPESVFYYEWAYVGNHSFYEDPVAKKPIGAVHHDEMIYLFSLNYRFPSIPYDSSPDSDMVDKMTAIWYNFARTGDPNSRGDTPELDGIRWPPMSTTERPYLRVVSQPTVHKNLFEHELRVWEELYPIKY